MSTIRRDFRASPHRTGAEAWTAIARLLAPKEDSAARKELLSVTGIIGQIISTESVKDYPIVSADSGPRVRIYCIYNEDALDEDSGNEAALAFDATSKDWKVSIPAEAEDMDWSQAELSKCSRRITVREKTEPFKSEDREASPSGLKVDPNEFLKQ
jgi:hypothetical protein